MEEATSKSNLLVRNEGIRTVKPTVKLYNLKMIIAVGMAIKRRRKELGLSQSELASRLGYNDHSTIKLDLKVQKEGSRTVKRAIKLYNLRMIIAIGMRGKSSTATLFRAWANGVLREKSLSGD